MSAGDIIRLNRMYNCPDFDNAQRTAMTMDGRILTQSSNGMAMMITGVASRGISSIMADNTSNDDLVMIQKNQQQHSDVKINDTNNLNDTHATTDGEDDMILNKEQIDALYSLNAAKRNGLKSAFHHWPMGIVPFEIDSTFSKSLANFSFYFIFIF